MVSTFHPTAPVSTCVLHDYTQVSPAFTEISRRLGLILSLLLINNAGIFYQESSLGDFHMLYLIIL